MPEQVVEGVGEHVPVAHAALMAELRDFALVANRRLPVTPPAHYGNMCSMLLAERPTVLVGHALGVLDSRVMAQGAGDSTEWEQLPDGCPGAEAVPVRGEFYRLVSGSDRDWQSHYANEGPEFCLDRPEVPLCDWHSISLSATPDKLRRYQKGGRWRNHRIIRFEVTPEMGLVRRDKGDHLSWWPHGSGWTPPPDPMSEVT